MNDNIKDIVKVLENIPKYELSCSGGCSCCGSFLESELDKYGEWVKVDDINKLIKVLKQD